MRPVVIVSNDRQNLKKKVVVIVPLTTKQLDKIYSFQVPVYFQKNPAKLNVNKFEPLLSKDLKRN